MTELIRPLRWDIPDGLHCALQLEAHNGRIRDRKDTGRWRVIVIDKSMSRVTYRSVYVAEGNDETAACDKSEE